jgi:hypothetical protein
MKKFIFVFALLIAYCTFCISNCSAQSWSPLGSGIKLSTPVIQSVNALFVYNNELIVGGEFDSAGGVHANNIARWNGATWSALGGGVNNGVYAITNYNNQLIACGIFDTAGGISVNKIAKWNGTIWSPLGSGVTGGNVSHINALTVYNNELIAGGWFTTAGGVTVNNIARWNGTTWLPLGGGIGGGSDKYVNTLFVFNNELIVGGYFTTAGGISANYIAKWNGTTWSTLGSGLSGTAYPYGECIDLKIFNNELIACGGFTTAGGISANRIARWNGTTWSPLGSGMNEQVYTLSVFNNELIAGGVFTNAGGTGANYIAKWNGTTWSPLGSGMNSSVLALSTFNSTLIAGGYFTTAGGVSANEIAKWGTTYTISGTVKYSDNNQSVTSGYVKTFRYNNATGNIIVIDSAQIQANGSYILNNVQQGDVYIGAVPNSSPPSDYVLTYYPSAIYYRNATVLSVNGNLTGININVFRMTLGTTSNSVNGEVNSAAPVAPLKYANVYVKNGNTFVGYKTTASDGIYHINSIPTGTLKIIADRIGYKSDSTTVNITRSNIDSVNFYLTKLSIGIEPVSTEIPDKYLLYQNYPNPFNPATNIRYQLKENSFVTLKIYNLLGKEIATLVNENQKAGIYETTFKADNLPSGIYFYRIAAGDFSETKKMILIK